MTRTLTDHTYLVFSGMHCDFACLLYKQLKTKLSKEEVYAIMEDAVETEVRRV